MINNAKRSNSILFYDRTLNALRRFRQKWFKLKLQKKHKLKAFYDDLKIFKDLNVTKRFTVLEKDLYPCLDDNISNTNFDAHYIYHPAWAARIIKNIAPDVHVDISSILNFSTILSAFVKVDFYDYRPAKLNLDNLQSLHADLTSLAFPSDSLTSVSCMHTIEHIGLGRYGDPLDPDGDLKAFDELKRVCAYDGNLLIVVPVGIKRIQFNAHRIYNPLDIIHYMSEFELKDFSLVDDEGNFTNNADLSIAASQKYGCGCYWFIKKIKHTNADS